MLKGAGSCDLCDLLLARVLSSERGGSIGEGRDPVKSLKLRLLPTNWCKRFPKSHKSQDRDLLSGLFSSMLRLN